MAVVSVQFIKFNVEVIIMSKCRTCFVSNSSSSSFIVCFDDENKIPKTKEEVKDLLYPNSDEDSIVDDYYENITVGQVVERFTNDIENYQPTDDDDLNDIIENSFHQYSHHFLKYVDNYKLLSEEVQTIYDEMKHKEENLRKLCDRLWRERKSISDNAEAETLSKEIDQMRKIVRDDYIKQVKENLIKDKKLFILHYGDEDGDLESVMEHGPHWDKLDVIVASNH